MIAFKRNPVSPHRTPSRETGFLLRNHFNRNAIWANGVSCNYITTAYQGKEVLKLLPLNSLQGTEGGRS
jgi:hypothetical protein